MLFFSDNQPHEDFQTYSKILLEEYDLIFPFHSKSINLDNIFIGREKEIDKLLDGILNTQQGIFVVSGHRGAGKSKFVEKALIELEKRIKSNNELLIKVIVPLSFLHSDLEIMGAILRGLKVCLATPILKNYIDKNIKNELDTTLRQIESDIEKIEDKNVSLNLSIPSNPPLGFTAGKSERVIEKKLLKDYSTKAKFEIIKIFKNLQERKLNNKKIRLVFIIDELDKVENMDAINEMLGSLKPIFNSTGSFYILMLSSGQYLDWLSRDLEKNTYNGLKTNPDLYINCIWEIQDALSLIINFEQPITKAGINFNHEEVLEYFIKYLIIQTQGNLYKLWHKDFPEYIKKQSNWSFLALSRSQIRKIRFYGDLYNLISNRVLVQNEDSVDYRSEMDILREKDLIKSSIYEIAIEIIKRGNRGFIKEEINSLIKAPTQSLENEINLLTELFIENLLQNEYIEKREQKYFLTNRRLIEKGISASTQNIDGSNAYQEPDTQKPIEKSSIVITEYGLAPFFTYTQEIHASLVAQENIVTLKVHDANPNRLSYETLNFVDKLDLGRGSDNDIQIHDKKISRYHARLAFSEEGWYIYDMNTKNGTFINEIPISKSFLNDGDIIFIGNTTIKFFNH